MDFKWDILYQFWISRIGEQSLQIRAVKCPSQTKGYVRVGYDWMLRSDFQRLLDGELSILRKESSASAILTAPKTTVRALSVNPGHHCFVAIMIAAICGEIRRMLDNGHNDWREMFRSIYEISIAHLEYCPWRGSAKYFLPPDKRRDELIANRLNELDGSPDAVLLLITDTYTQFAEKYCAVYYDVHD